MREGARRMKSRKAARMTLSSLNVSNACLLIVLPLTTAICVVFFSATRYWGKSSICKSLHRTTTTNKSSNHLTSSSSSLQELCAICVMFSCDCLKYGCCCGVRPAAGSEASPSEVQVDSNASRGTVASHRWRVAGWSGCRPLRGPRD